MADNYNLTFGDDVFSAHFALDATNVLPSFEGLSLISLGFILSYFLLKKLISTPHELAVAGLIFVSSICSILISFYINFVPDDSYAHFRVVDNLIEGGQYVFNKNELVEGTATPLWHLILVAFHILTFDIPLAARAIGSGAIPVLVVGACALFNALRDQSSSLKWTDFLAVTLLIALNPIVFVYAASGMETIIFATLSVYFALFLVKQNYKYVYILGLALILIRFDGFLIASALTILHIVKAYLKKQSIHKYMILFVFFLFSFLIIGLMRHLYFGDFIPHVIQMKTLNDAAIYAGFTYLAAFLTIFFPLLIVIFYVVATNLRLFKSSLWEIVILLITSFGVIASVSLGGGDWMPVGRYFVVASLYLTIAFCLLNHHLSGSFQLHSKLTYVIKSIVLFWPIVALNVGTPSLGNAYYMNTKPPIEFIKSLNEDARGLSIAGNVVKAITVEYGQPASIYTRWIGFIPHHIGIENTVIDELSYFYAWHESELPSFRKTTKIAHIFEAHSRIISQKPDIIINAGPNFDHRILRLSTNKSAIHKAYKLDPSKKLSKGVIKFIEDNYVAVRLTNTSQTKQFQVLMSKKYYFKSGQ